jgi:hypothetical protein
MPITVRCWGDATAAVPIQLVWRLGAVDFWAGLGQMLFALSEDSAGESF